jgi:hypothetical protein
MPHESAEHCVPSPGLALVILALWSVVVLTFLVALATTVFNRSAEKPAATIRPSHALKVTNASNGVAFSTPKQANADGQVERRNRELGIASAQSKSGVRPLGVAHRAWSDRWRPIRGRSYSAYPSMPRFETRERVGRMGKVNAKRQRRQDAEETKYVRDWETGEELNAGSAVPDLEGPVHD